MSSGNISIPRSSTVSAIRNSTLGTHRNPCRFSIGPQDSDGFRPFGTEAPTRASESDGIGYGFLTGDGNSHRKTPLFVGTGGRFGASKTFSADANLARDDPQRVLIFKSRGPNRIGSLNMAYDCQPTGPPSDAGETEHYEARSLIISEMPEGVLVSVDCCGASSIIQEGASGSGFGGQA